jgi:glutamate-5-semialdehyde dehydrogenase
MAAATARGLAPAMLDRLALDPKRVEAMVCGLQEVAALPDPIGTVLGAWKRPNGLVIEKVRVPLGVIGIIYESRPNVTADAAALCLKAGNAAILRGGSESVHCSGAILAAIQGGLAAHGLPTDAVQRPPTTDRAAVGEMLRMTEQIDVIIPRGGKSLTQRVAEESRVPVIKHLDGICHTYVHRSADPEMAAGVIFNGKMRRTGVCGATEAVLIDSDAVSSHGPAIIARLLAGGCEVRGTEAIQALDPRIVAASAADWGTEYLAPVIAIGTVPDTAAAIAHIEQHGSHHTDAIVAEDIEAAALFLAQVDSAIVMHNASTQFADGGEFGLGAEIGISTGKLHARGPVSAAELTSTKYRVLGTGQTRP